MLHVINLDRGLLSMFLTWMLSYLQLRSKRRRPNQQGILLTIVKYCACVLIIFYSQNGKN